MEEASISWGRVHSSYQESADDTEQQQMILPRKKGATEGTVPVVGP